LLKSINGLFTTQILVADGKIESAKGKFVFLSYILQSSP